MTINNTQSYQDTLKKLKRKAELCRFSHSELKTEYTKYRNWKEFIILLVSVILFVLIKESLSFIWILPIVITVMQGLDNIVFHWTNKTGKHESAVAIWGHWLRDADFLEKNLQNYEDNIINEKMKNIQEKYANCMDNTTQIPNSKFLKYKKRFKAYRLKSEAIDNMSLKDLEG